MNQCISSTALHLTKLQFLCRVRSPKPSQGLMWAESATPHNGSSEVMGEMNQSQPFTTKKKNPTSPSVSQDCIGFLTAMTNSLRISNICSIGCAVSDSQRTGNPCLGTWEDGSEAAAYMALSCPVVSNNSIPPAGFHHHGALQCSEQHPLLETRNPEN